MTTAPNSLTPRAHIINMPVNTPGQACGSVTYQNACHGVAPSASAASSYSESTCANASRPAFTRNGRPTNAIATAIPAMVSVKVMPIGAKSRPKIPRRPKTINSATPAAVCGITRGRLTNACTSRLPAKRRRAVR
jgi:hypothetical protein